MKKHEDVPFEVLSSMGDEAPAEGVTAGGGAADDMDERGTADADAGADDVPMAMTASDSDAETTSTRSRKSAWKVLSSEDMPAVSLREILGGDYLIGSFLRHNIGFILLLVVMGIVYISNRYGAQQEIVEEGNLRRELQDKKNYALTQYALLTTQTRQSALERRLKSLGDSTLLSAKEPPFIIIKK